LLALSGIPPDVGISPHGFTNNLLSPDPIPPQPTKEEAMIQRTTKDLEYEALDEIASEVPLPPNVTSVGVLEENLDHSIPSAPKRRARPDTSTPHPAPLNPMARRVSLTVAIDASLLKRLRLCAVERETPVRTLVEDLIRNGC
jgi:hypothetical protein